MKIMPPALKDRLIFFGWVAGLIVAASLLWSLTFSFRAGCLLRVTNKELASLEDDRRLAAPLPRYARSAPLGCWYSMDDDSLFFVFAVFQGGILVPCGAEINAEGRVVDIIPLGRHARKVLERIPRGQIQIYTRRIESAAAGGKEAL